MTSPKIKMDSGGSDDHLTHVAAEFGAKGITQDRNPVTKEQTSEENVKVAVTLISDSGESTGAQIFKGEKNPYKCKNCHKIFKNNGALHTHMKTYEERPISKQSKDSCESQFKCETCGRLFKNKGAFHTHLKTHKQNSKSFITNGNDVEGREKRSYSNINQNKKESSKVDNGDEGLKKSSAEGSISMLPVKQDLPCVVFVDKNSLNSQFKSDRINDSGSKSKGNGNFVDEVKVNFEGDINNETNKRSMRRHEKFVCKICGKEFESRGGLLVHNQVHDGEKKLFKCQVCDNVYVTKGALEKHLKSHKLEDSTFHPSNGSNHKCIVCNQHFRLKGYLGKHIKRCHPGHSVKINDRLLKDQESTVDKDDHDSFPSRSVNSYKCKICSKAFQYKSFLLRHTKCHSKDMYKCASCGQIMTQGDSVTHKKTCRQSLKGEENVDEDIPDKLSDKVCDEFLKQETDLQNHSISQYLKNSHKCDMCGKSFERKETFSSHVLFHQSSRGSNSSSGGGKSHQCKICAKRFAKSYVLKYHMASHKEGDSLKCSICNRIFKSKISFQFHMEAHKAKPYKCSVCGWRLRHRKSFDKHKMIHEERCFKCSVCNEAFIKKMDLTKHIESHDKQGGHMEMKKTQLKAPLVDSNALPVCTVCNKVLATRKALLSHMRMHRGERYKCEFCHKSFNRMYTLKSHLKIIHKKVLVNNKQGLEGELIKLNFSNQVLFKCPVCGFVFIHRKELVGHMRIHTGQKPHECSTCHATFNGRHHLQEHMNTQHPEVVRPTKKDPCHMCAICSKTFTKRCDLKRHLKVHQKRGHVIPASLLK